MIFDVSHLVTSELTLVVGISPALKFLSASSDIEFQSRPSTGGLVSVREPSSKAPPLGRRG